MKIFKPLFWEKKISLISIILLPVSLIVKLAAYLKRKLTKPIIFKIPIICVGNIYLGGTGKTPLSIYIANELTKLKKKPLIIRKFYKNHSDEHRLIKKNYKHFITNSNRSTGIINAQNNNYDTVILDDGFQECKIKKNLNIICFSQNQLAGNEMVIPSGPLRESLNALKYADLILINGKKVSDFEKKILKINNKLKIFYSNYIPVNIDQFKGKKLLAIAGIGNPNNFFELLEDYDLNIEKKISFPDHYKFTPSDIKKIVSEAKKNNLEVVMTEKDYLKIKDLNDEVFHYIPISLEVDNKAKFINEIVRIYDQNF